VNLIRTSYKKGGKKMKLTFFCQAANQNAPSEPKEKKTEGQLNLCIRPGENASPVTEPKYMPLYTKANDRLLSPTGTQRESKLFMAGIATPCPTKPKSKTTTKIKSHNQNQKPQPKSQTKTKMKPKLMGVRSDPMKEEN